MERIKLDRKEKAVLRALLRGDGQRPAGLDPQEWSDIVDTLEELGLAQGAWATGHELVAAQLTNKGRRYFRRNPRLRNPVDWKWIVLAILGLLGLFACARGHAAALTAVACLAYCLAR